MNNGKGRHQQFSPTEISKVLARYRQSGLGVLKFAHDEGIPPGRLHYWIYQKGRTRRNEPRRVSVSKPVFQELKVETMLPVVDGWVAEVNLPGGLPHAGDPPCMILGPKTGRFMRFGTRVLPADSAFETAKLTNLGSNQSQAH